MQEDAPAVIGTTVAGFANGWAAPWKHSATRTSVGDPARERPCPRQRPQRSAAPTAHRSEGQPTAQDRRGVRDSAVPGTVVCGSSLREMIEKFQVGDPEPRARLLAPGEQIVHLACRVRRPRRPPGRGRPVTSAATFGRRSDTAKGMCRVAPEHAPELVKRGVRQRIRTCALYRVKVITGLRPGLFRSR